MLLYIHILYLFTYKSIFIVFCLQYFIVFKLFMCITLFIYTNKNILIINGIIFSVFRGSDERF